MNIIGLIAFICAGIFFMVQVIKLIKEIKLKRENKRKNLNSMSQDDENNLKEI